jgi:hypothetical protein
MADKKSYGKTNKRKGSDAERLYAKIFRDELGFSHCKTARMGSKLHDDAGIDLIFLPFNVQIKAGYDKGLNPSKELSYIEEKMVELFPPSSIEHTLPKILIHRKNKEKGRRNRIPYDDIVFMTFEDFKKILQFNMKK